jgi:hypothetical protein
LILTISAIAVFAGTSPMLTETSVAQTGAPVEADELENEIVVSVYTYSDIVVNGRARRCQPMASDPLDKVTIRVDVDPHTGMPRPVYLAIVPDGHGGYVSVPNQEQITGPEFWQRVGVGIDQYVFRAPSSGNPMCVGGGQGSESGDGFAGFRRVVDAAPNRGHRLRFTARVATGRAGQVSFWLAAGTEWREDRRQFEVRRTPGNALLNGGNTNNVPFGGNHDWTPILLETGPIHKDADHISYGFNLQGSGDVWVYEPKLEMVLDQPENASTDDLIVIGNDPD